MVYLPVKLLKPGMIVAKNVNTHTIRKLGIPLIRHGVSLTSKMLSNLRSHGIYGIYIEKKGTQDIVAEDPLDENLKNKTLLEIKRVFDAFDKSDEKMSAQSVSNILDISEELIDNIISNQNMLISLIELKSHDDYTYIHSLCVALLSIATGAAMGYSRSKLKELSTAALMHDIGKVTIPVAIINKPAKLTTEEFEEIKQHPARGRNLLEARQHLVSYSVLSGIRSHHEKYDGTGYPQGLTENTIHPYAKIIAVADVYDALTSDRPYRKASSPCEAVEYIMSGSGTHFDFEIVHAFLKKITAFPVGSKILLSDGRFALVIKNYSANIMRPLVQILDENDTLLQYLDLLNDVSCHNITVLGMA